MAHSDPAKHPLLHPHFQMPWVPPIEIADFDPDKCNPNEAVDVRRLRYLQPDDVAKCVYLGDLIWHGKMGQTTHTLTQQITDMFRTGQSRWFVMQLGVEIVGFAGLRQSWIAPGAYELIGVHVHPKHQQQGIGRMLTDVRLELIKALGGKYVQIATIRPGFFESCGFTDIDATPDNWVVMRHIIDPERRYFRGI